LHVVGVTAGQCPAPSHFVARSIVVALAQLAARHVVVAS
jgi:hypothetical protein